MQNQFFTLRTMLVLCWAVIPLFLTACPVEEQVVLAASSSRSDHSDHGDHGDHSGSLRVYLHPEQAIADGARWRVDGGRWRRSGDTQRSLSSGRHEVTYRDLENWTAPAPESVEIEARERTKISADYTPRSQATGSLTVTIAPDEANEAGARWRVDGGAWHASEAKVDGLTPGTHEVTFLPVDGWSAPSSAGVSIVAGETSALAAVYTLLPAPTGSLRVTISPDAANAAGARWRVDGGAWNGSGAQVDGLLPGAHEVTFLPVDGWDSPSSVGVAIVAGETSALAAVYTLVPALTGSLRVTIAPESANTAGARWQVDGGAWNESGAQVDGLAAGAHAVAFLDVSGWTRPNAVQVVVESNAVATYEAQYLAISAGAGGLTVYIDPAPAVDEGAQWAVDGGAWTDSGTTLYDLAAGEHQLTFKAVGGWTTPNPTVASVSMDANTDITQIYRLELGSYVVIGYNDLGMHCMNDDFSSLMILPPFNNVHAQVIRRGGEPRILTSGIQVNYSIPGNTTSYTKTNFWDYDVALFGVDLPLDVGLTGNGLAGQMLPQREEGDWLVTGIPVTPINDNGELDAYPLAKITVTQSGTQIARTNTVVPVSWEISCNLCHSPEDSSMSYKDILNDHDALHGTDLINQQPVVCGSCHAQAPLGLTGLPGVPSLSSAMHGAHASRMGMVVLDNSCYACHPGVETNCQRDVHFAAGMVCSDCHGSMEAVADPTRRPWQDEPKCGSCHQRSHFSFEEPGKLYRESRGHHEVECAVCHGSPHAITPTVTPADNAQAIMHQGFPGVLDCAVCHIRRPGDEFEHHL